jgi:uncharacterized membrane protein YdjX (TVP38/TMEM64 family)
VRWLGLEGLTASGSWLRDHQVAPLAVVAVFLAATPVLFPATLLVGATVLFHPWPYGAAYAWGASLAAAALGYAIGRLLPRAEVRGRWGPQTMWLRGQLRRRGLLGIAVARLVPVGNFAVMNMVAGSLRVPFFRFLLGNAVGLLPGILAISLFTNRVSKAVRTPAVENVAVLLGLILAAAWALWWLGHRLARNSSSVSRGLVTAKGTP